MSLKKELENAAKLDSYLRIQIGILADDTDENEPLFSALLLMRSADKIQIPGVTLGSQIGNIWTARELSLKNLKALVDCHEVSYVEGSRQMSLDTVAKKAPVSLKEELAKATKLTGSLPLLIAQLPADTDENKPLFKAIIKLDSNKAFKAEGVDLNPIAGPIYTAHDLSLKNLKTLVDSPRVKVVEGSRKIGPA